MDKDVTIQTGKKGALSTRGLSVDYKSDVKQFNKWLNGRKVSWATILEYFQERGEDCKPATLRRNKAALKSALRRGMGGRLTLGELAQFREFFDGIQPGKSNPAVTGEKVLTPEELKRLVKAAGPKTGLIIKALFETAARVSELLSVKLKDCHPGRQGIAIQITRHKTRTTDIVYLRKALFDEVRAAYQGKKYLFEAKGKPVSRFTVATLIKRAGAKIGRPEVHAHTLRHSWATAALPVLGLAKVSKYLGHARVDTTARSYLHGQPSEEEVTAVNVLQFSE